MTRLPPLAEDDDGLAAERTALAWNRTGVALLACGAAVVKGLPAFAHPDGRPIAGGVIIALAMVAGGVGAWQDRARRRALAAGETAVGEVIVRRVAYVNVAIGLAAFALAVLIG